jgi:ABC-type glycerol-3-phosphate transport system substrate-binding protein
MSAMVKDGLAATNSDIGTGASDNFLGIRGGAHAMTIDSSAALGTVTAILGAGNDPNIELGVGAMPGPGAGAVRGGVFVQGGELFMVNKSAPAKQAAAWQFLKFLDDPKNITTWAIGTGYLPIRTSSAESTEMQDYWAANPTFTVAYDQLVSGPDSVATAGSVIGPNIEVRAAVRDAENTMFLEGTNAKAAIAAAADAATEAIVDYNSRIGA